MRWLLLFAACLGAGCYYPAYAPQGRPATAPTVTPAPGGAGVEVMVSGGEGTEVLVEGVAALPAQGGWDIARDAALDDALRKAVEQGVGAYIDAESRVENFQLLSDRIYSQTRGYVSSYRVITEGPEGGLYRAVIRARVKSADIENDLAAIGILVREQGRPRMMVVVKELENPLDFTVDDRLMSQTMFETMLVDRLQQKGFPVVDAATVRANIEKEQLKLILEGDTRTAALVGLKAGAEVVVAGTVQRSETARPVAGSRLDFYRFRTSVRAVNVETGEVLAASATTTELPFSEDQARQRAADTTGAELVSKVLAGWTRHENVAVIYATNADFARVQALRLEIREKLRGIIDVITRDLVGTTATIEVVSETSSPEVIDGLLTRGITTGFEVTGKSGNRLEIRFTDGAGGGTGDDSPGRGNR
ncbi:hypothetical protein JXB37_01555 [candidate division WOR-3 bacterium]|nr:hypothetical protein [candidate division WOR-3 bacterium]